ncbi:hypothetical protein SISSUDRAFT_969273, partial [Sistotremastrum suecicum HHB10207 ss-3]
PEQGMEMETANTSLNRTEGKLANLPLTIGPLTVYVQIQVVKDSPVDMLLGMPFSTLVQSRYDTFDDGFMVLTCRDPN